jgi:site-specific DNA-methyltransferase (adenine-specific)
MILLHGDCLDLMGTLEPGSVDMILADLPYGTTACKWDTVIPFEPLWAHYKRIIKKNGAIVLTASQPFTSALVMSNPGWFKYAWVWEKSCPTRFFDAEFQPLKQHEDIVVFSSGAITWAGRARRMSYYPQGVQRCNRMRRRGSAGENYQRSKGFAFQRGENYPRSIIKASRDGSVHSTQKPVALMEYLIRTYTNEGETVLDNTMGSGTTGVACVQTNRLFIGIEQDEGYFNITKARIAKVLAERKELLVA